eukprot:c11814_g1_i2.p1 GENE.c11814_g1_i2~~c11814_g1_i2.p1  ORF type:complete len:289 (+),score=77.66 c11814_g1_i2:114-980(+)
MVSNSALKIFSQVIGWLYFSAWSISFYPQVILNFKLRSVEGLSFDFVFLNLLGFGCYSTYCILLYCKDCNVAINDIAFALHAVVLCSVVLFQVMIYPKGANPGLHKWCLVVLIVLVVSIAINAILSACDVSLPHQDLGNDSLGNYNWTVGWLGYVKMFISFIKYMPQVYLNYHRKSTIGWSIVNIVLDFTGGVLSFGQQVTDAHVSGDWGKVTANPVKLGLSIQSVVFDVIFMVQHFILYPEHAAIAKPPSTPDMESSNDFYGKNNSSNKKKSQLLTQPLMFGNGSSN